MNDNQQKFLYKPKSYILDPHSVDVYFSNHIFNLKLKEARLWKVVEKDTHFQEDTFLICDFGKNNLVRLYFGELIFRHCESTDYQRFKKYKLISYTH